MKAAGFPVYHASGSERSDALTLNPSPGGEGLEMLKLLGDEGYKHNIIIGQAEACPYSKKSVL
jgi:hypothetical protein